MHLPVHVAGCGHHQYCLQMIATTATAWCHQLTGNGTQDCFGISPIAFGLLKHFPPACSVCSTLPPSLTFRVQPQMSPERKLHNLDRLAWSDMFETFLSRKYSAAKRFGLEGCETLIPGLKCMTDKAADLGVQHIVMGMPHRGAPGSGRHAVMGMQATTRRVRSG